MAKEKRELKLKTPPADFEILGSSFYTIAQEMGVNIERTARAPIFFSAHDFVVAIAKPDGDLVSLAEYIPVLVGACPFAIRAVNEYYKGDIHDGDVFLCNDPYTLAGGNQLADWCIVTPVFYKGKQVFTVAVKAHQADTGGGVPGGYNPNALDIWGEGLRIPPMRIIEGGKERGDVLNLILTNVRLYEMQHSDLLCMIAATRIGARRLTGLIDMWGKETVATYIDDVSNYADFMMREQVERIPDGTYHDEVKPLSPGRYNDASIIQCDMIIKGSNMTLDFTKCGPQVKEYINSTLANTHSSVWLTLLTSLGRGIRREYRNQGCFRMLTILTKEGTIVHPTIPATEGNDTNFAAAEIIDVVEACLALALPEEVSAGWGHIPYWAFSGIDPRRGRGYGTPDFQSCATGAGAIWGTDGWCTNGPQICSGTLWYPEIEVAESVYPILWERWELAPDSGAPGRWRGGLGVHNVWVADADPEPINIAYCAEPYDYEVKPAIVGGMIPKPNSKRLLMKDGHWETEEDTRRKAIYQLHNGDKVVDYSQGGCGVGSPLERDVEAVREDVRNELVSVKSAHEDYGVIVDPVSFEIDREGTEKLRKEMKAKAKA
jgi:N-methylhydantoinase B